MRLIKMIPWWLSFVFCIVLSNTAIGAKAPKLFIEGINAYNQGDYDLAVESFTKIADQGIANDKLFYNIGNAFFKRDDLGQALVWYERASKISPSDPDLKFNLDFARSRVKDEIEGKKGSIFRILFFWKYLLSSKSIQWTACILNGIFWLILAVNALLRKKTSRLFCWVTSVLIFIFVSTALYNYYEEKYVKYAIVISDKVSIQSGWSLDSTELFVLHEGTKVKIEKEQKDFYRIYFSKGKIGWINKADAEVI